MVKECSYTKHILIIQLSDLINFSDDDNASDIVFDSDDENETASKKNKASKVKGDDIKALFASADEFATLLEDEGSSMVAPGGSNVYANKDNAGK